jgi:protein-S-isoprenylcysteine O-methyltransferase Ste14
MNNLDQQQQRISLRRAASALLAFAISCTLFVFLADWTSGWTKGRLFILVFFGTLTVSFLILRGANPQVLVARGRFQQGTKRWDRIVLCFFTLGMIAIFPIAMIDHQFQWSYLPWPVCSVGYLLLFVGTAIVTWAEAKNKFFEMTVRIQTERGHKVVNNGPYAIVRHPGYVGFLLGLIGSALALGSLWALIPAGLASLVLVLRTRWEDQTLQAELEGYKEYTQTVRYKLIPGLW